MVSRWGRTWIRVQWWALPAVLALCVSVPKVTEGGFRADTGWYAAIALQAWREGALWTLQAEPGLAFFNKPPLTLWIHGLPLWLGGPSLWAARLPSVVAALACVLITTAIARELCGRRVALATGLILALTPEMMRHGRAISPDLWQLLFMLLAVWLVVIGARRSDRRLVVLSGLPIGLALLCKPLVALLAPALLAIWLVAIGRRLLLGASAMSVLVAGLVAAPWHLSMLALHGADFPRQYVGNQVIDRAAGRLNDIGHSSQPLYYLGKLCRSYWPWLPVAALGLVAIVRGRFTRDSAAAALAMIWTAGWLVALSVFTDRRPRYALPLYPMLALPAGLLLVRAAAPRLRPLRRIVPWLAPVAVGLSVVAMLVPARAHRGEHPAWIELFQWMEQEGIEELWQGGFEGSRSARIYLKFGWWPHTTHDHGGQMVRQPPGSARLIYHWRDGLAPGPGERLLFESEASVLRITELETPPWDPSPIEDPGEDAMDLDDDTDPA